MAVVYVGVGSNLGDRRENIRRAVELLKEDREIESVESSALIETEPVGGPPQGKFLNGALRLKTDLLPLELLSRLKGVERRLGRAKDAQPNAPRPIDLDILFYDDVLAEGKNLKIPHPRLAERRFVLEPLCEIAPDLKHPRLGKTVRELLESLSDARRPQPTDAP